MPQFDSFASDLSSLPLEIVASIVSAELPSLLTGPQNAGLAERLLVGTDLDWASLNSMQQRLCTSGLWLLAGNLDQSHVISQDLESAEGSFWHGIMHRREGDFGNAKYWFGRVGEQPVFDQIQQCCGDSYVDPIEFVDTCRLALHADETTEAHPLVSTCKQVQWIEWQLLMVRCMRIVS